MRLDMRYVLIVAILITSCIGSPDEFDASTDTDHTTIGRLDGIPEDLPERPDIEPIKLPDGDPCWQRHTTERDAGSNG
jgi:hypothetical protein